MPALLLQVNDLARFTVCDLSLTVAAGESLGIYGPSGGGKTTLLRCLAGLELPDHGEVRLDGQVLNGPGVFVPPERRPVGLVFQSFALFPHLTVRENVLFGLQGVARAQSEKICAEFLELLKISELAGRYPHEMSGGQQQRVALARSLAPAPKLLLLDEPFSNLDPELRADLRRELRQVLLQCGVTTLLVSHERSDLAACCDRTARLSSGVLEPEVSQDALPLDE
ncbi:MAG: ATP-binding cassette domain-containing protein [Verrucomicrobiota bacterium]